MLPKEGDRFARRYRIDRILGRGAMGVVFEATHETLGQRVAIKVLRRELEPHDDERATKRFVREAKLAARLGSPHVVKILDVDHTDDDIPYIVMERLEGRDLAAEVEARGTIPTDESIGWMLAICDAMIEAHAAGVVHRDLKLSNVFLCNDGTVKVLDFGVAALGAGEVESSTVTSVAGTTRYMAPEQLLGEAPDPKSDVWAVGVMAYRLVAGRFPYEAPTAAAQMLAIMEGCPPIASLVPDVSPALATAIHGALGRTLEERCASMEKLRDDLRAGIERPAIAEAPAASAKGGPRDAVDRRSTTGATPDPSKSRVAKLVVVATGIGLALVIGRDVVRRRDEAIVPAPKPAISTSSVPSASGAAPSSAPIGSATASAPPVISPVTSVATTARATPTPSQLPPRPAPSASSPPKPSGSGDGFPNHL